MKYPLVVTIILALFMTLTVHAEVETLSPRRLPTESYKWKAFQAGLIGNSINGYLGNGIRITQEGPYESRKPLAEVRRENLPLWAGTYSDLQKTFEQMRDTRVLTQDPSFPRRPTWLYPDDGCYARAAILSHEADALTVTKPGKIFAFGDLNLKTPNSPTGEVTWWYHVVVGYRFANDIYVFDPSVEPRHPLLLEKWIELLGGENADSSIAICDPGAFSPDSSCFGMKEISIQNSYEIQNRYLEPEWSRLEELNRDPVQELGEKPPWLFQLPDQEKK